MELRRLTDHVFYTMFSKETDRPVFGYINGQRLYRLISLRAGYIPTRKR